MSDFGMCFGCGNFKEVKLFNASPYCKECEPNPDPKPEKEKKVYKLRPLSKKRNKQNNDYLKKRREYLLRHKECKPNEEGCEGEANQIHHMKGREGGLLTDETYFLECCNNCHRLIEDNPEWAINMGYSVSRTKTN